jgi:hypothetical protein
MDQSLPLRETPIAQAGEVKAYAVGRDLDAKTEVVQLAPVDTSGSPGGRGTASEGLAHFSLNQQADRSKEQAYSTLEFSSYDDPVAESPGGAVNNTYTLLFFEDWDVSQTNFVASVDLPYVNRIAMTAPNAMKRTRGMDNSVYVEHAGFAQRTFTIEGRSGAVWNPPEDLNVLNISRFTKLRNFMELYGKTSAVNKNALVRGKNTQLVLRFSFEDEQFLCDVVDFSYRRSTDTSTYSFEYTLTLITNDHIGKKRRSSSLLDGVSEPSTEISDLPEFGRSSPEEVMPKLSNFFKGLTNLSRAQGTPIKYPNLFTQLTCDGIVQARLFIAQLCLWLEQLERNAPQNQTEIARIRYELGVMGLLLDASVLAKGRSGSPCPAPPWSDLYYRLAGGYADATALRDALAALFGGYVPPSSLIFYEQDNKLPARQAFYQPRPVFPVGYFDTWTVPAQGADAFSIAHYVFGDRNLYWRIIAINDMQDAYTRGDGTPLAPGSTVLIPSEGKTSTKSQDILGTDLLIVNGDLQLVGNNDVQRVSGYACYSQNLTHRMQTPQGSNKVCPEYGLLPNIHGSASSSIVSEIRSNIRDQLHQDHRTDKVTRLTLQEQGDKVRVSAVVTPISGQAKSVAFTYTFPDGRPQ